MKKDVSTKNQEVFLDELFVDELSSVEDLIVIRGGDKKPDKTGDWCGIGCPDSSGDACGISC